MDNYDKAKKDIDELLLADDVVDEEDTVSAYSLYEMTKNRLSDLYGINNNKVLENKILSVYKKRNIKSYFKGLRSECRVIPSVVGNNMEIMVKIGLDDYSYLCKDIGDDHFYCSKFRSMVNQDILDECILDFYVMFDVLEDYKNLITFEDKNGNSEHKSSDSFRFIVDDKFEGSIRYDDNGNVGYKLRIKDLDNYFEDKNWYGDRDNINDYLDKISPTLLKKIPLCVDTLNESFKRIYNEQKEKEKMYTK